MEHLFHPERAYKEIARILKPGGVYIHTTPIYKETPRTRVCARIQDGQIEYLDPPEYHGNPIDSSGSLVTFKYGQDLIELIGSWAPFDIEIRNFHDRTHGLIAEFLEVIVCRKRAA
jgi:SAM-dependent methyltransferase